MSNHLIRSLDRDIARKNNDVDEAVRKARICADLHGKESKQYKEARARVMEQKDKLWDLRVERAGRENVIGSAVPTVREYFAAVRTLFGDEA